VEVDFEVDVQVEEALALWADTAEEKGLELVADLPTGPAVRRRGDPGRVRQVLMHLVGNAIKFTERGEVVVRLTVLRTDRLLLEVSDTGIGIPPAQQGRIFEPFVQGDGSSTRRHAGTGLGLALVKRLVTLMGGRIGVVSEPGRGTRFWVELPLPPADRAEETDEAWVPPDLRVLVMEPVAAQRRALTLQLRAYARVEAVAGIEEARAALAAGAFHVAMLAHDQPAEDSLRLVQAWRGGAAPADLKIVLLGPPSDLSITARLRQAGVDQVLVKPVRRLQLRRTLSRLLTAPATPERGEAMAVVPLAPRPAAGSGARVLMAEDNLVNQKVAARYLERLGHEVDFAQDGGEALELLAMQRYDVVLMDAQMPVVDGFEVTRRIRAGQVPNLAADVQIVGLTAYAHDQDRDRWLEVGADDILAKPLRFEEVQAVLERHRLRRLEPVLDDGEGRVLDEEQFNELRDLQDEESPTFLLDMIDLFARETPERRTELVAALDDGDAKRATQLAHTLKGASANFGGRRLQRLCLRMEEHGKAGRLREARELLGQFDRELMALLKALELQKQRMHGENTRG
jgi:two-component system sensor histidine kinase/response regulator